MRQRRELERLLHKEAMEQYILQEQNPLIVEQIRNDEMTNVNRNTIKRIKKDLVQSDDRFLNLREKF